MNWESVKLGSLGEFRNGLNYSKENEGEGLKVISVKNFGDLRVPNYDELDEINPDGVNAKDSRLEAGDIIFVRSNGNKDLIGRSMYIEETMPDVSYSGFCIRFRNHSANVRSKFLAYYFRSPMFRRTLSNLGGGTNINNLNQTVLKNFEVSVPNPAEQEKILATISSYDDLIENNRRRIALLEEAARLLYREWFVHFRFPGHEHVKIIDGVPEGWEQKAIGDIARVYRGKSYKSSELREEGGKAFANLKCIQRYGGFRISGLKRFEGDHKEHHTLRPGDIVMAVTDMTREAMIVAQAGRIPAIVNEDAIYSMDLVKVVPHESIPSNWLYSLFRYSGFSFDVREHANGTNVLHLKPKHIENWISPIPPPSLMQEFVSIIDPMINQQDRLELQIHHLEKARDLLLPRLMDGRLEV